MGQAFGFDAGVGGGAAVAVDDGAGDGFGGAAVGVLGGVWASPRLLRPVSQGFSGCGAELLGAIPDVGVDVDDHGRILWLPRKPC